MMDISISKVLMKIFDWSEVWGVLIPLVVLFRLRKKQPDHFWPVIVYLWFALAINLVADIIQDFKHYLPFWMQKNNVLYNVHSVVRFVCFSYFFSLLYPTRFTALKKILPVIFIVFLTVNFSIAENFLYPEHISGNLHAAESFLLLIYCMSYYLAELKEDKKFLLTGKDFLVVTGLSLYVATNFFIFLFYVPMLSYNRDLAVNMWNVHNAAYIMLCLFIARSFYANA